MSLESLLRKELVPVFALVTKEVLKKYIVKEEIQRETKDVVFTLVDGSKISVRNDLLSDINEKFAYLVLVDMEYAKRLLLTLYALRLSKLALKLKKFLEEEKSGNKA